MSIKKKSIMKDNQSVSSDDYSSDDYSSEDVKSTESFNNIINNNEQIKKLLNKKYYSYPLRNYMIKSYIANIELSLYTNKLSINRKLTQEHFMEIYNIQNNNLKNNKPIYFAGIVTLCNYNNKLYIIDGQHRIKAMRKLFKKYKNIDNRINDVTFRVDLIDVNTYEDMIDILKMINTIVQLDIESLKIQAKNDIRIFFEDNFKFGKRCILSRSSRCMRPYICETKLLDEICKYDKLINLDKDLLFKLINDINKKYSKYETKKLLFNNKTITSNMKNTAKALNCYLGFDTDFDWIKDINKIVESDMKLYGLLD